MTAARPRSACGGITVGNAVLILAIFAGLVVAGGAFLEPGASWGIWLLWGVSVYGVIGLLWTAVEPMREGVVQLKSGKRREAIGSLTAGLALAALALAGFAYLGHRLYLAIRVTSGLP